MNIRTSGILLPIQSLSSTTGVGDLGPETRRFIDFLCDAGQNIWQILPINPTLAEHEHSPYHSPSAFAFNPLLISPEMMIDAGYLENADLHDMPDFPPGRIDYETSRQLKETLFARAHDRFREDDPEFEKFCCQHAHWLDDYALFIALSRHYQTTRWHQWPEPIRNREPGALVTATLKLSREISFIRFVQYIFYKQWINFKTACNDKGIQIMGDLPVYVPHESADVWVHPELFKLDAHMTPVAVTGVPPDYFSETGQRWGHPVYKWDAHRESCFDWWMRRIQHNLDLYDYLRIDHFRGLVAYWEIPVNEKTAVNGKWINAPVRDFFNTLFHRMPCAPVIAEDLGYITADVREIIREYEIPGMRVLIFGFDSPSGNPNAPHNIDSSCVVYTGTHDTNTARGWFDNEAGTSGKERVFSYFGRTMTATEFADELVRTAYMSRAWLCIIPMQDLLSLGSDARINRPGSGEGNWQWRLEKTQINTSLAARMRQMAERFGRTEFSGKEKKNRYGGCNSPADPE